ncbi:surface-adhesin E family protein [Ferruginibacter sp. SUN002]|uniref:surface-adhesin E family protein n=1 Tax=Ferruginibacter sp. SUN002 TaxID=2937789 RepID=UPI003D363D24
MKPLFLIFLISLCINSYCQDIVVDTSASVKTQDQSSSTSSWLYITSTSDANSDIYMKSSYENKEYSIIKIWMKIKRKVLKLDKKVYRNAYELFLYEFDCYNKKMRAIKVVSYNSKSELVDSYNDDNVEFDDIVPDTIGSEMFKKVCEKFN